MAGQNYLLKREEERDGARGHADAGLAGIAARFTAEAGPVGVAAEAAADLGGGGPGGHHRGRELVTADDVWPADLQPAVLTAAGTLDLGSEWGPTTGFALRLTEVTILLGSGTSLVQVYKNSALSTVGLKFQTSSSGLWEPSRMYLLYGERLVVVSTGGGVTIVFDGERIATHFLPTYMA